MFLRTAPVPVLLMLLLAGCAQPDGGGGDGLAGERDLSGFGAGSCDLPDQLPEPRHPVATIETNYGTIKADIFLDMVPVTAQNFIDHAEDGDYDDTLSHRIINDFMMQVGNLNTKGKSLDDYPFPEGGSESIPDEFHHRLRHDQAGRLSMANSGPNTGTTQFFVTFAPTPWLDDRHSVFGQVTEGLDVLETIEAEAGISSAEAGQRPPPPPKAEVRIESINITHEDRPSTPAFGAALWTYDDTQPLPAEGGWTRFIVILENLSEHVLPVCLQSDAPDGVTVRLEEEFADLDVPARQRVAVVVDVEAEEGDAEAFDLIATTVDGQEVARLALNLDRTAQFGEPVETGDEVTGNYIGLTVDGRVFDTSVPAVADKARDDDLGYATFNHRGSYSPFTFTPGGGVIQGFTDLAVGTPEGGSSAGRIPPKDAYGTSGQSPLAGRTLLFQLDVLQVEQS